MADLPKVEPRTPVLVGIGLVMQREEDPSAALEPIALMIDAARRAGDDTGVAGALAGVGRILVPHGRWKYGDPGRMIARAIGATQARTVFSKVGVLQQTLIGDACRRIAAGDEQAVLVVGGDAGYRILRGSITGTPLEETPDEGVPDETLSPHAALRAPAELAVGLTMPVGLYAVIESAYRANRGETLDSHRDRIAELYAGFSRVAAANPHAWSRTAFGPQDIREAGPGNPMQAFPYTKRHCSSWSVDQASALLFMSAGRAAELGIPPEKWVHALASSESNHMLTVSSRREMHRSPGARVAGAAALDAAGVSIEQVSHIELYSCFPSAVQIVAGELGVPGDRQLTVTGGMSFAGGPYNNYALHATAQMGESLRREGGTGLVSCISGVITKQAFGLWSTSPPRAPFAFADVTDEVARIAPPLEVVEAHSGDATVAGHTVLHSRGAPPRGIVIADIGGNRRAVAMTEEPAVVAPMETQDFCGRPVHIEGNAFRPA